jgi:phosphatidylethanolamine/phosphatidyl-N-methylethanolamine N-methyltransferase
MRKASVKHKKEAQGRRAFLSAWLRAPRSMGSITPSSRFLGRKIASQVDVHHPGWVIELGGGTGTVTKAVLEAGVKPERMIVIERDRRLCAHLEQNFPHIRVLRADATLLKDLLASEKVHKVSAVVSCLPLLTLPDEVVEKVLEQVFEILPAEGVMVQYTYGPRSPVPRKMQKRLGLKAKRAGRVLLNVPPATVWCYWKAGQK